MGRTRQVGIILRSDIRSLSPRSLETSGPTLSQLSISRAPWTAQDPRAGKSNILVAGTDNFCKQVRYQMRYLSTKQTHPPPTHNITATQSARQAIANNQSWSHYRVTPGGRVQCYSGVYWPLQQIGACDPYHIRSWHRRDHGHSLPWGVPPPWHPIQGSIHESTVLQTRYCTCAHYHLSPPVQRPDRVC